MKQTTNMFANNVRLSRAAVITSLIVASATVGSTQAQAAVICSNFQAPVSIPNTTSGIYFNFVNGTSGTAAQAPGWDLNLWGSSSVLKFFASTGANNTTSYVGSGAEVSLLASGTLIDSSSTTTTSSGATAFIGGVTNGYVGVVFKNEGTAVINYGWATLTTTGPSGFPATVNQYCYQNDGTGIMAGTMPVSLQSYTID